MLAQMPPVGGMSNQARKPGMLPPKPGLTTSSGPMPVTPGYQRTAAPETLPSMTPQTTMPPQTAMPPQSAGAPPSYGTNGGNPRYGTDNAPPGGVRPPVPGGGVNPAWGPQGGVSPFNASSGATGIGDFQRFSDNAYNESVRRLDPQFEAQQRSFEQDMVNRGISPGTEAYDNARANFDQSRNDAYATARAQADQMGLAAQQQSFGQGAVNSQGLRELLLGQMGADASRYGADASASASRYGSDVSGQAAANRLGFDRDQGDFSNLMQMLLFGQGTNSQNNNAIGQNNNSQNQWFSQNGGLLGLFGGGNAPGNIDVSSPYNNQYNGQLNTAQYNQAQQNANNQMYAQLFASMLCDRNAKDEISTVDPEDALAAVTSIPLVCWSYKAGPDRAPHVGTYAQEFNAALGLPEDTKISTIDLLGSLIGSVQALTARIKELEAA